MATLERLRGELKKGKVMTRCPLEDRIQARSENYSWDVFGGRLDCGEYLSTVLILNTACWGPFQET